MKFNGFQVTTQDGFILSLQRIPVGRSGESPGNRVPVLLQHGLLMVSNYAETLVSFFIMYDLTGCDMIAGWNNLAAITTRTIFSFPLG